VLTSATLLSIQTGRPEPLPGVETTENPVISAIFKRPVDWDRYPGGIPLGVEGLEGDEQADRRNHGGPFRAVNVYPAEHYQHWHTVPGLEGMSGGAFGENFTTLGLLEDTVSIGDVFRVGEVIVSVTQPRGPCYKLNRKWRSPDLQQRAEQLGRVGWYLRVLQPGRVRAGLPLELIERPSPEWTIARVWSVYRGPASPDDLRRLAAAPGLSDGWRDALIRRLEK